MLLAKKWLVMNAKQPHPAYGQVPIRDFSLIIIQKNVGSIAQLDK